MTANNYRNDYPVIDGRIVCQGHADACAEFGHATYTIDGVDQGYCPRCNEVTEKAAPAPVAEAIEPGTVVLVTSAPFFLRRGVVVDTNDHEGRPLCYVKLPGEGDVLIAAADLIALPEETKRRYFARRKARELDALLEAVAAEEESALAAAEDAAIRNLGERRENAEPVLLGVAIREIVENMIPLAEERKRADLARIDAELAALQAAEATLSRHFGNLGASSALPGGRAWIAVAEAIRELGAERRRTEQS